MCKLADCANMNDIEFCCKVDILRMKYKTDTDKDDYKMDSNISKYVEYEYESDHDWRLCWDFDYLWPRE